MATLTLTSVQACQDKDGQVGKGSSPRPIPDRDRFESNWDNIFNNKEAEQIDQPEKESTVSNEHGSEQSRATNGL